MRKITSILTFLTLLVISKGLLFPQSLQIIPVKMGNYDTPGRVYGVYISRNYACVADGESGKLNILEVTAYANATDDSPTASITSPSEGSTVRGTLNIQATATDDVGISEVEFYIDDEKVGEDTNSPYEYSWNTASYSDGEHTLKTVVYDTSNQTAEDEITVTVDNSTQQFMSNLTGASAIYIDHNKKLRKINLSGDTSPVISTDPDVEQFQFDANNNLYIVFSEKQPLNDGNSYILVKFNPEDNSTVGIDKDLTGMAWKTNTVSPNIQFDGEGNIYYLARKENDKLVLRKYVSDSEITEFINDNINVNHWLVRSDGTVLIGGETVSTGAKWLRKISPTGEISNLTAPADVGWILDFPDNRVYAGLPESAPYEGVYRLSEDLSYIDNTAALSPYIGYTSKGFTPEYDVDTLAAEHDTAYCKGFTDTAGTTLLGYAKKDDDEILGLTGSGNFRTVLYYYPTPEIIELKLVDRITLMRESLGQLVIPGTLKGVNKLILYDLTTKNELNILYENIEIYHLDVLSSGTILFDGLNFTNNKYIVGMFERAVGASGKVRILTNGYTELTQLSGQASNFAVVQSSTDSSLSVEVTSPTHGSTVSGTVDITTSVTAENDISKVEFYIDDELKETDTATPYTYSWDTTTVSDGSHTIKAKVTDTESQTAEDEIAVTVSNTSPGEIKLSESQLYFGATSGSNPTASQIVKITQTGSVALNWTATPSENWLQVSPTSGTGAGKITVSVNTTGLSEGTYTGTITIEDSNATNSPQSLSVTLEIYSPASVQAPFGSVDTPIDGTTGVAGAISVSGWALDDIEVTKVEIWREPVEDEPTAENGLVFIGDATLVEGARSDIEQEYPDYPFSYRAAWGYMLLTNYLPNQGNTTYTICAIAYDKEGNITELGTTTITCDNTSATQPFGTIDTPTQGGEASGDDYLNFGWALTPQPNSILVDGSTITVYIDGEEAGNPMYGQYREDVAVLFPEYANSDGAVGYFYIDTTAYESGVHTIAWGVEDNAGNTADIGTRYFTIFNTEATGLLQTGMRSRRIDLDTPLSLEFLNGLPTNFEPIKFIRGYKKDSEPETAVADSYGVITIEIREVERVAVEFGKITDCKGYLVVGEELRPLPIGSTLNTKTATFSWQPGPGFIGEYHFVFLTQDDTGLKKRTSIKINILPKFSIN